MKSYYGIAKMKNPINFISLMDENVRTYAEMQDGKYKGFWHVLPSKFRTLLVHTLQWKPKDIAESYNFCYRFRVKLEREYV